MQQTVSPQQLSGTIAAIPSKSWAHRELIAAALGAPDHAVLVRFRGGSNDIEATCRALRGLGAKIERLPGTGARVEGISRAELNTRTETPVLDCGESGTTLRYLLPIAAALSGPAGVIFTGSGRLPARPQEPLAGELERHGITLDYAEASPGALLPVRLTGRLLPGAYALSGAVSSQFLGGLLYALSVLDGPSTLAVKDRLESEPYVRMTLSALAESGVEIAESRTDQGLPLWTIAGRGVLTPPEDVQVEGDWSNAAFWLCAGALTQNPEGIAVEGLSLTSLQGDRAVVDILSRFGAQVESSSEGRIGTVRIKPPKNGAALRGQTIDARQIPDLVPILAVAAGAAEGETRFTHAERLRIKESDRLQSTAQLLHLLGVPHEELPDGLVVHGIGSARKFSGGRISSFKDHRIVMAAAVAGASGGAPIVIDGAEDAAKSYPHFFEDLEQLKGSAAPADLKTRN